MISLGPFSMRVRPLIVLSFLVGGGTFACGPELDPISRVGSLRILGVSKSAPYARPGERVQMHMLWEDGSGKLSEDVSVFFGFWCLNPAGDTYATCLAEAPNVEPQFTLNSSNFELTIPENSLRPSVVDPSLPAYGTAFVFYGICAGTLDVSNLGANPDSALDLGEGVLPRCLDEEERELGTDDFVIGYSTIFVYDELRNDNPIMTGFEVNGESVQVDCIDDECREPFPIPELTECTPGVACIEACDDDGEVETCPEIKIEAIIDSASAELDDLANLGASDALQESMWVSYFADRGNVSPPVKLVNDARAGWQSDVSSSVFAPKEEGPVRIWAVVRDNRGGSAWVRIPAYVK